MKRHTFFAVTTVLSLLLCGCNQQSSNDSGQSSNQNAETTALSTNESRGDAESSAAQTDAQLPVISIETVSQDANVMKFVTEPVAAHVAEAIASWTPDYEIPPAPYYESCKITLTDAENNCTLENAEAEVKVRGNWTTVYDKKPLRLKFTEKQNLLGMNDGAQCKNWLLLAEYKDASMLRDKTALSIAREILEPHGLYAADAQFVEVYINQEYYGVYLLTEQQQIHSARIDIAEAEKDYQGTDIGYLLEFDGYFYNEDPLQQFHVEYADNASLIPYDGNGGNDGKRKITCLPQIHSDPKKDVGISIQNEIYSQEQHDFIASYVNNVYQILYSAAYEDTAYVFNADYSAIEQTTDLTPQQAVEQVIDVQSLADMYLVSELTCDADIYWSSFYMDVDFSAEGNKKLTFEAPWDFDSSMGNKDRCIDGDGFYAANIVPDVDGGPQNGGAYVTINPWLAVLMYEDWYQDIIRKTWTEVYDSGAFSRAVDMIESDSTQYKDAFTRNYDKWDNIRHNEAFAQELSAPAAKCKTEEEAAAFLKEWLQKRVAFMDEQWHLSE